MNTMRRVGWQVPMAVVLLCGFVGLGVIAHLARAGTAVDHRVLDWVVTQRNGALTDVATFITDLVSPAAVVLIAIGAAALIWVRIRDALPAIVVVATVGVASVVNTLGKWVVGSHRPPPALQLLAETDHSFPSGHVTGTAALLGILAVVAGAHRGHTVRLLVAAAVATIIVAGTRLYLGVHWLTDVSGGVLLGSAAVLLGWAVLVKSADGTPETTEDAAEATLSR